MNVISILVQMINISISYKNILNRVRVGFSPAQPKGTFPLGSLRTVREPLNSYDFY